MSKKLLTSTSFMAPIDTLVECKTDTAMKEEKESTAVVAKRGIISSSRLRKIANHHWMGPILVVNKYPLRSRLKASKTLPQ